MRSLTRSKNACFSRNPPDRRFACNSSARCLSEDVSDFQSICDWDISNEEDFQPTFSKVVIFFPLSIAAAIASSDWRGRLRIGPLRRGGLDGDWVAAMAAAASVWSLPLCVGVTEPEPDGDISLARRFCSCCCKYRMTSGSSLGRQTVSLHVSSRPFGSRWRAQEEGWRRS